MGILLKNDWCGWAHRTWVVSFLDGQFWMIRMQAEQANKEHPSVASASVPASKFLTSLSSCPDFSQ